jgi:hypothetical protein
MKRGKEEWGRHKGERKSSRFCDKKGDDWDKEGSN